MPKIINAYSDASGSIADSLKSLGETMFGNGAHNQVYREQATSLGRANTNIPLLADAVRRGDKNALAYYGVMSNKTGADTANFNLLSSTNNAKSVDDTQVGLAQLGAHEPIASTAVGQGRALANARAISSEATNRAAQTQLSIDARTLTPMMDTGGKIQMVPKSEVASYRQMGWNASNDPNNQATNTTHITTNTADNAQRAASAEEATRRQAETQVAITDRAMKQKQWEDDHQLVNLRGPDGKITMVPKSQVSNLQAHGYDVMPTLDQTKVNMLTPPANPNVPVGTTGDSGAPAAMPTVGMDPDRRSMLGLPTTVQNFVHPQSGATGTSQDNGQTITLPDGTRVSAVGSGFQPTSAEANVGVTRDNLVKRSAATPLVIPDATNSAAAADANTTTGIVPFIQKHANATIGALPGGSTVLEAATGSPEIGAGTERARSAQEVRLQQARSTLLGAAGRASVQAQKWVHELLPDGSALDNPATAAQKIKTVVSALAADHEQERTLVNDPNTLPAERQRLVAHMHQIEATIKLFTSPQRAQEAPPPAKRGAAPSAGAQPPAQRQAGQVYPTPKGPMQWTGTGWLPATQ